MDSVDVLDAGIHTVAGHGNDTWDAMMGQRDPDVFQIPGMSLPELGRSALRDAMLGEWPIEALFLGSSSDSYSQREKGHVYRPRLAAALADYAGVDHSFQFSNACASSSYAIAAAMDAIRASEFDVVIAGGADEVTASSVAGFQAARIYGERCDPFGVNRKKLVLSDGAAFVVLAREGLYDTAVGQMEGAGLVSGAQDMASMNGDGPFRALDAAITESEHAKIDLIVAHGTGTIVNDAAESDAIARMYENPPTVVSYKRWLGHPQGASGAIGVVLALEAMERGRIFATTPFPDPELAVAGAVTISSRAHQAHRAAVLSHGTWGVYSALILSGSV